MLSKLHDKKKIIIILLAILLVVCFGIAIIGISKSDKDDRADSDTKIEQDSSRETDKDNNGLGLEVLEPDVEHTDNISDASGTWNGENTENANQTDNEEEENDNNPTDTTKEDEDILEDDIVWGDIY